MTSLAATLLYMHVVWVTPTLEPVYARHFREDELGAELRALEQAEQLELAADLAGVPLELLTAVMHDESGLNAALIGAAGELGPAQLLPGTPWWRGWREACRGEVDGKLTAPSPGTCQAANVRWGAYALRDALDACGGDEWAALGFYRAGRCVRGPRGAATLELAEWLAWRLADDGHATIEVEAVEPQRVLDEPLRARAEFASLPSVHGEVWVVLQPDLPPELGEGDAPLLDQCGEQLAWCRHGRSVSAREGDRVAEPMCRAVRQ